MEGWRNGREQDATTEGVGGAQRAGVQNAGRRHDSVALGTRPRPVASPCLTPTTTPTTAARRSHGCPTPPGSPSTSWVHPRISMALYWIARPKTWWTAAQPPPHPTLCFHGGNATVSSFTEMAFCLFAKNGGRRARGTRPGPRWHHEIVNGRPGWRQPVRRRVYFHQV